MPNPKHSTTNKRVSRAVIGIGKMTREAQRLEISDTRRAQVYRSDPALFAPPDVPNTKAITLEELERIVHLREVEGLSWEKIGNCVGRSGAGCHNAYKRHLTKLRERNESGT